MSSNKLRTPFKMIIGSMTNWVHRAKLHTLPHVPSFNLGTADQLVNCVLPAGQNVMQGETLRTQRPVSAPHWELCCGASWLSSFRVRHEKAFGITASFPAPVSLLLPSILQQHFLLPLSSPLITPPAVCWAGPHSLPLVVALGETLLLFYLANVETPLTHLRSQCLSLSFLTWFPELDSKTQELFCLSW